MLVNQHDTETQNCQFIAPHHMANEKGGGGEDEVIPIPVQNQSFITHCSAFVAPDSASCLHVGHWLKLNPRRPQGGA